MKAFFEEYGLIIVGLIAIFILIAMTTPVGDAIKGAILSAVDSLKNVVSTTPEAETTTSAIKMFTSF